jgi:hypothetical protein
MELIDFGDGHEVLGYHQNGKSYRLKLQIAVIPENDQGKNYDDTCLERSLPHPDEEAKNRKIVG